MIHFQSFGSEQISRVETIYAEMGWTNYLGNTRQLTKAFDQSLDILGVFDGAKLVGFIRCVGDGEHILMVQDLIVAKAYQQQGLGSQLFQTIWDKYAHVRMFQVNTDLEDPVDNHFYQKFGMKKLEEGSMVSYFRL
ncbi:GNAT family N-acetyltransferase [Streptococcus saliviloxodontae]|uniref:Ribosomal protein S18 acetylase RimI-like enzyme n=1 Tax=Streptococcus saliviloxodontae TaxID=1349416 RepID=A0ABS2PQC4_9STRE|nr:GNAT family N-acetyltransferase [Streptococcus saliviloxodontae]MBM7636988.1 ribosomal protein S18 acetylase RimI-like enzyme [Streptococcus saliviloxodontae]